MGFESWPKAEKTPNEIKAELEKEGKKLPTVEEVLRAKELGNTPASLRIKKWEEMTPEEREEEKKKENDLRVRPAVRI